MDWYCRLEGFVCGGCNECGNIKDKDEGCASLTKKSVEDYLKWRETGEDPTPWYRGLSLI